MGDSDGTVWAIEPHTQAKHELLTRYLDAWFPIMTSWSTKVLYIDGFAGPGRYEGGEPGSPMLAVDVARGRNARLARAKLIFLFIESDKARHDELAARVDEIASGLPGNFEVRVANEDFAAAAEQIVANRGVRSLVPTFAFVDPFGWAGIPLGLIANLTRDKRSELFILFSYNSLNRWLSNPEQQANMRALFGGDEFLQAVGMRPAERKEFLADLYERQLKTVGKFAYVSRFEMIEKAGRTSYFLYHCTRSLKGLEVMRSAMWKIDPLSGRQFSDKVAGLEQIFDGPLIFDLEERLVAQFKGKRAPISAIHQFLLEETPFAPEHLKKLTLKPMQERGLIEVFNQKRRGTFPDGVEVSFL